MICIFLDVVYIKLLSQLNAVLVELKRFNKIWKKIKKQLDKCKIRCILSAVLSPKSFGWFEIGFEKKSKKVSNSIWQKKKVCYIKLLSRFSSDRKQKRWFWKKSLKKNQTSLDKVEKCAILRTRCPLNGDSLK